MEKNKLTRVLQCLLLFAIFVFIGMIIFDIHTSIVANNTLGEVVDELDKRIENNITDNDVKTNENITNTNLETNGENGEEKNTITKPINTSVKIGNSTVYGKIKIDKIGIEYPIIHYVNDSSLWKSICKISNNTINGTGNLCLAGHNMRNMTMFGKLKKLKVGDKVEITNIYGDKYIYKVFKCYYVDPSDVGVLKNTTEPIVTMITCNNTSSKRLIVQARLE